MSNILIYCTNGSGWVSVDGKRETMTKDAFCFIPAGMPHTYAADRDDPWTIYWVHFSGEHAGRTLLDDDSSRTFAENQFGENSSRDQSGNISPVNHTEAIVLGDQASSKPQKEPSGNTLSYNQANKITVGAPAGSTTADSNRMVPPGKGVVRQSFLDAAGKAARIRLFEGIYQALASEYAEKNLEYASMVLHHFLGSFTHEQQFAGAGEPRYEDLTSRAIAYMKQHLYKKIGLEEIANHCGTSVSHFCLRFKSSTSHTPVEYLNNLRIQQACQLLDLTTLKISEISEQLGFSDPFYFSRVFKKSIGQSPKEYRKQKSG
ncbi:MAG: AraC family transcriptional regulator [Bacteroidales bacterium]|nr:AraC family transcriptional regulator [Bacteroidales bacterium]